MKIEREICHDCGVKEGEIHELGCDMERCPFCHNQLLSCMCCYIKLGLYDEAKDSDTTSHLPPKIYSGGLTEEQDKRWLVILEQKGRVPFISLPLCCAKCLKPYPDFFMVSEEKWKQLPQSIHSKILCKECYDIITGWLVGARRRVSHNP